MLKLLTKKMTAKYVCDIIKQTNGGCYEYT